MSGDVHDLVAAYLTENPTASANETVREVRKNRTAVLAAYRALKGPDGASTGSALATRENRYPAPQGGSFGVEGARWTATSLELPADLAFDDYEHIGFALGEITDMCRWALGDWINYGEAAYGEKYAQAVEATGRRPQTLMNYASVARRVARSRRRAGVSWSVHAEVASLSPDEQDRWLARAEANRWTVDELRGMLKPELELPTSVEVVPEVAAEEALVLDVYRQLKREHGDRVTPKRVRRLVENRLGREDRTLDSERARLASLTAEAALRETIRVGDGIELHRGDFRTALADLSDESVDLVFTDPPYHADFLPLWTDLALLAARVLKPGRMLVSYSGNVHTDHVIELLGEHLDFVTMGAIELPGPQSRIHGIGMHVGCKPLLFFSAGRYEPRGSFSNFARHDAPEKSHHVWQQPLTVAAYYIQALTEPGELILDPFVGGGTAAVAARNLGRRFVGCDIDEQSIAQTLERLTEVGS